ncbi:PD-(D/E)XK nuclease family protein [Actinomycetospora soli]|uniref:PD-(D/E)XK nuclease family protein n=1 Tax=Actinomycetospora soli TaxID=2893887 RepID=UPI001E5573CD|nr:PD-(D/E)XK nuclease family protein [Actinomycetospora soli]MCD2186616.1 PD-(D/E)XK nuclease family protein [Actinomycetospora soli]
MPTTVTTTPYGAAAYNALRRAVHEAKSGNPLELVTIVVPSERIGVAARRALARGDHEHPPGIAALSILTLRRIAETRAANQLLAQGRRPLTGPSLADAVRRRLSAEPGPFAPVAEHIGTVRALAEAHRTLKPHTAATLDALGNDEVVRGTVALHRALAADLHTTTYDETDLLRAASDQAHDGGKLVLFLPQDLDLPELTLLQTLSRTGDLHVVLGLTSHEDADAGPLAVARALGHDLQPDDDAIPTAARVLHASDPDDEVRAVVRRVAEDLAIYEGHRIAVLHASADPYARLLHEHLRRADIAFFGRGIRPAVETAYGRTVLRLLALPDHDFARTEVLGVVAGGPVHHRDQHAPSSAWERVSRAAGVTRGAAWSRLETFASHARTKATDERQREAAREWLAARHDRDADTADQLFAFVAHLQAELSRLDDADTWADATYAVRNLLELLADDLPPEDAAAARRVDATLTAAGTGFTAPSRRRVIELLELELDAVLDRVGTIGVGVHVGPVSEGIGDDVDRVYVLGAAEGLLPPRTADDPLLPDRARARTHGTLPTTSERTARRHRHVLAALAAAPREGRTMSFPRGDLRRGGERVPSRWLLPTLRALGRDRGLQATKWREIDHRLEPSTSYPAALLTTGTPASAQEWRQVAAVAGTLDGDETITRAQRLRRERASEQFTAYDGNLAGEDVPDPTASDRLSPTALEDWVRCPHAYFQFRLLGVGPVEEPEEVVQISAVERGFVLHDVWDKLVNAALAEGWAPGPGEPWPPRAADRLEALAESAFEEAVERGVTGARLLWDQDQRTLMRDLTTWLAKDDERRLRLDEAVPIGAEYAFGQGTTPAVGIELGDGRQLRLRGTIDRVDRRRDGGLAVTDYKTGRADSYKAITPDDPTDHGQRLQLPVYALAARANYGDGPVRSEYWFTSLKGGFTPIGYDVTDDVLEETRRVLRVIVDSIRDGVFLARPPKSSFWGCAWCAPDGLSTEHVREVWDRKHSGAEQLRAMLGEGS